MDDSESNIEHSPTSAADLDTNDNPRNLVWLIR
jgi:hypothetical protein